MGLDIGQVRHPEPVGVLGFEATLDEVSGAALGLITAGGALEAATAHSSEAQLTHQALDGAPGHVDPLTVELAPDLVGPIDAAVLCMNPDDLDL